jgi:hypothetical protein
MVKEERRMCRMKSRRKRKRGRERIKRRQEGQDIK